MKSKMNVVALTSVAALVATIVACGGRDTVASRSAEAYDEARGSGPEVGGHASATSPSAATAAQAVDHSKMDHGSASAVDHSTMDHSGMAGSDHSKMDHGSMASMDHSKMDHGSMAAMDHSKMNHGAAADHSKMNHRGTSMDHSKMNHATASGVDHSKMNHAQTAGMDHSGMDHSRGVDHSAMNHAGSTSTDHSKMNQAHTPANHATMDHAQTSRTDHSAHGQTTGATHLNEPAMQHGQHGSSSTIPPGGLWGPVRGASPAATGAAATPTATALRPMTVTLGTAPVPQSSNEMGRLRPSATLRQDSVDLAAPVSIQEAAKSSAAPSHEGHEMESPTPSAPGGDAHQHHTAPAAPSPDPHAAHRSSATATAPKATETVTYTCPMHPEVTSEEPGRCPKCGMKLVKKEQ